MGESSRLAGSRSTTIRVMGGALQLLAEVLVLKGMTMRDVLTRTRGKGMVSVSGVGVVASEGREPEGRGRDWEDGEERARVCRRRQGCQGGMRRWGFNGDERKRSRGSIRL